MLAYVVQLRVQLCTVGTPWSEAEDADIVKGAEMWQEHGSSGSDNNHLLTKSKTQRPNGYEQNTK